MRLLKRKNECGKDNTNTGIEAKNHVPCPQLVGKSTLNKPIEY